MQCAKHCSREFKSIECIRVAVLQKRIRNSIHLHRNALSDFKIWNNCTIAIDTTQFNCIQIVVMLIINNNKFAFADMAFELNRSSSLWHKYLIVIFPELAMLSIDWYTYTEQIVHFHWIIRGLEITWYISIALAFNLKMISFTCRIHFIY